jgi:hypothetical protein
MSGNYPSNYGNSESCTVKLVGGSATTVAFTTESGYDKLSGASGNSFAATVQAGTTLQWSSDGSETRAGFKICVDAASAPEPAPEPPVAPPVVGPSPPDNTSDGTTGPTSGGSGSAGETASSSCQVTLMDSYGDGWSGARLRCENGVFGANFGSGSSQTETVESPCELDKSNESYSSEVSVSGMSYNSSSGVYSC